MLFIFFFSSPVCARCRERQNLSPNFMILLDLVFFIHYHVNLKKKKERKAETSYSSLGLFLCMIVKDRSLLLLKSVSTHFKSCSLLFYIIP